MHLPFIKSIDFHVERCLTFGGSRKQIMTIHLGSDHAGYDMKEHIHAFLKAKGFTVEDHGTYSSERADYPDFAHAVATSVEATSEDLGMLFCGSGNGVCITANHHKGIRASLSWNEEVAALARQHNNANVLCFPARFVSNEVAEQMALAWLNAEFEGGRHQQRIDKIPVQ